MIMYRQLVFQKPPMLNKKQILEKFKLIEVFNNKRTCILENDDISFSIDKKVIRVFLYNDKDKVLLNTVKDYFYEK